jgi:antitoxin component of RelBE/YafQ-DinJ toxin-antitoxin module
MPRTSKSPNITFRSTADDRKVIAALSKQLGVAVSQVIRLGLRALATKEGVTA